MTWSVRRSVDRSVGMSLFLKWGGSFTSVLTFSSEMASTVLYIFSSEMASLTNFMETLKALAATFPKVRSL